MQNSSHHDNVDVSYSGFPRSIESIEKELNFKIGFQDLEKVLKLAKIRIWY